MKTYSEPQKILPVIYEADVIVAGSGPAGVAAALGAARMGSKTLLIEQCGCVGGISTAGLMSHWTGTVDSLLYREILDRSADGSTLIDPERLKTTYLEMLDEAGVTLLLYTFVSDVIMEENRVCGLIIENKSGRQAVYGKVVIDATGDGDVAYKAGVPYVKGRETDGKMQPVTAMFKVAGVDDSRAVHLWSFESTYQTPKGELQALAKKHLPFPAGHVLLYPSSLAGVVTCNMTNCIDIDGTKTEDLTKAEFICRSQMGKIVEFLREYVPGYENCFLISSASLIGVRETRHFKGEYTITAEDILAARQFEDWVVRGALFNFDVHNISGAGLDETGAQAKFGQTKGYTIPYGCLVPVGFDGLLLAGRNISGTHIAHSNYRVMPICVGMGFAAGVAAALSVEKGIAPRAVQPQEIQKRVY